MQYQYTVNVYTSEDKEDPDYTVLVSRHGMELDRFIGSMLPASLQIGKIVMANVEQQEKDPL
jgi:hypothetical protein